MRLIPKEIFLETATSEKTVQKLLKDIRPSRDIALHSLNIAKHPQKKWAEADFVLLRSTGLFVLEVKGGRVEHKNGLWNTKDRYGKRHRLRESPLEQAKTAYYAIEKEYINKIYGLDISLSVGGWAAVFPDISRIDFQELGDLPEMPFELLAFKEDCSSYRSFEKYLDRVHSHWSKPNKENYGLNESEISKILNAIRPDFEMVPRLGHTLNEHDQKLLTFTQEQRIILDATRVNDQIIVTGGAGSGKTFIAIALAREEAASGQNVLFVTRSHYLAAWLDNGNLPKEVEIKCLDEIMTNDTGHGKYDVLILDEAQDMCQLDTYLTLDGFLKNGFKSGRWRWFGDPNHQVSQTQIFEEEVYNEFRSNNAVVLQLPKNVRNTPKIVDNIEILSGVALEEPQTTGKGGSVSIRKYDENSDPYQELTNVLKKLFQDEKDVPYSEVVILTPEEQKVEEICSFLKKLTVPVNPLMPDVIKKNPDAIKVSSVESFKGLESAIVVILGLASEIDTPKIPSIIYRSFSRAKHSIFLICSAREAKVLREISKRIINV